MKKIADLNFGFNDAVNYKKPENKEMFEKFFFKTDEFQKFISNKKGIGVPEKVPPEKEAQEEPTVFGKPVT